MNTLLECSNINKVFLFNKTSCEIIKNISLKLKKNQSIAITGASGSGKSSFLHILGGIDSPTLGSIKVLDKLINNKNRDRIRNQNIGFVFQSFYLIESMSVIENILMPALIGKKNCKINSDVYTRAMYLLDIVGMRDKAANKPSFLSGGEKQRIAIARALINDPDILLVDEPTGNLDNESSEIIHSILIDNTVKRGKGLIAVTHDMQLAHQCSQSYELKNGLLY